ncbi:bifunctional 2-methylcitrate synthase/citrate synthase [Tautonia sociabilis]|uniref:Citrate synthase n=1 Tax=Tautonia sociabilis TaxID=2080755 RepID=A0A432MQ21_9BACT|nr:bifunctional 2-methylcitrate synthase/citrate synthase [Tautonia sociabilis]RUL89339.1 bifunctional 2-methylcitrate synthase/citrate synthase [Tautonia sociabilis]
MDGQAIRVKKGLEGVVFDETAISEVIAERQMLLYRGYPVAELADRCSFEEVAYLLLHGDLPDREQLGAFCDRERRHRPIDEGTIALLRSSPPGHLPMDALRTAVSYLGMTGPLRGEEDAVGIVRKAELLLAAMPTIVAADSRLRKGEEPIPPRDDLPFSENFFHMCFGKIPSPELVRAFDASLTLYAEHGFNASSFTARVVASSLSDLCSAVTAAIGSLKGPLHGGANEAVMRMLVEIGSPERARDWVLAALADRRKIMGFGHRVYRSGDSRVPTMKRYRDRVAAAVGDHRWIAISDVVEETMRERTGIPANLDFPAGPTYALMGFDSALFTPIFAMARVAGWCAHVAEQLASNRIVRPLGAYVGPPEREVVPLEERGTGPLP